jgi:hypothetical protein
MIVVPGKTTHRTMICPDTNNKHRFMKGVARLLSLVVILVSTSAWSADETQSSDDTRKPGTEVVWEFDAYYSNVGIFVPLTDKPIPVLQEKDELSIYRQLLKASFPPRFFLFEASVMPLPILGVYLKKNHRHFYDNAKVGEVNLIESVTAGFQEPYALTLFFGNVATFALPGEDRKDTNKGYMGYMFSGGHQHIKDNVLINDKWLQMEWKLKGDREFRNVIHRWSFRLGVILHENRDIEDIGYLGFRRSDLDFKAPFLSWLKNIHVQLRSDFALDDGEFMRQELTFGKKYPLRNRRVSLNFDVGFIWENEERYGTRYRNADDSEFTLVLRPNIEF